MLHPFGLFSDAYSCCQKSLRHNQVQLGTYLTLSVDLIAKWSGEAAMRCRAQQNTAALCWHLKGLATGNASQRAPDQVRPGVDCPYWQFIVGPEMFMLARRRGGVPINQGRVWRGRGRALKGEFQGRGEGKLILTQGRLAVLFYVSTWCWQSGQKK